MGLRSGTLWNLMEEHSMKSKNQVAWFSQRLQNSRNGPAAGLETENVLGQLPCSGASPFQYRQGAADASWVCMLLAGPSSLLSSNGSAWGAAVGLQTLI